MYGGGACGQEVADGRKELILPKDEIMPRIQKMADKMPGEWLACLDSSDCGLVSYNCMHEALAVNKPHLAEAQAVICRTELCSWMQCAPAVYKFSAACEKGLCVTKPELF